MSTNSQFNHEAQWAPRSICQKSNERECLSSQWLLKSNVVQMKARRGASYIENTAEPQGLPHIYTDRKHQRPSISASALNLTSTLCTQLPINTCACSTTT